MSRRPALDRLICAGLAGLAAFAVFVPECARAQDAPQDASGSRAQAEQLADIFSKVGDQIYEECIFELSQEQIDVQQGLIEAYVKEGAEGGVARRLAATQIQPPKLSAKCEMVRSSPEASPSSWTTNVESPPAAAEAPKKPDVAQLPDVQKPAASVQPAPAVAALPKVKTKPVPPQPAPSVTLAGRKILPQWDCADNVDFVTIHLNGYERKLTGGEICNPYQDVVREVPASVTAFRLGYTIKTGRLFIVANGHEANGQTIAWAISGRDVCRNNPDPDCLAARAIGPLPPGEYAFGGSKTNRVTWGPRTKRHVAGVYLKRLWNKDRFNPQQTAAILARGNIAIHVRLKGEMSEACIGLEPKGWAYVASLIKEGRAEGLNVYIDEPHTAIAEAPPLVEGSTFSLSSLFK